MGIGYQGGIDQEGVHLTHEWNYPRPSVCISCMDGHTAVLLDYRNVSDGEEPPVVFVDMEAGPGEGAVTVLAPDFQSFIDQLVSSETRYVIGYPVPYQAERIMQAVDDLGLVTHQRFQDKNGMVDWVTVELSGIRGYEKTQADVMFSPNTADQYPELDCSLLAKLDVEDRMAESVIDELNRRMKQAFSCEGTRIHKPYRWLSSFKYHANPLRTGAVERRRFTCICCQQERTYAYNGPFYTAVDDVEDLCIWCVADGSAARIYNGDFVDISSSDRVENRSAVEELQFRTPSYRGWQQEIWLAHCHDYCTFVDYVGKEELQPLLHDPVLKEDLQALAEECRLTVEELLNSMHPDGWHVGYLFRCLHCGHYRLHHDFS